MKEIKKRFKRESITRFILVVIGVFSFIFSPSFAWGFIIAAIISKENIDLKTKESWIILGLITGIMIFALYFLLNKTAVFAYIISTIIYFLLRKLLKQLNFIL